MKTYPWDSTDKAGPIRIWAPIQHNSFTDSSFTWTLRIRIHTLRRRLASFTNQKVLEIEKDREGERVCLWSYVNARASEKLSAGVLVGMGNPNKTESEATWAAKEGEIKTVGEGGGGLRFLERAISGSVALLTAMEASVLLHSLWKWECKALLGWWWSYRRSSRSTELGWVWEINMVFQFWFGKAER